MGVVPGITPEATVLAIQAAALAAGVGGTVVLDAVYVIDAPVYPLEEQTWTGGGTIARGMDVVAELVAPTPVGATTIEVATPHEYRVGHRLCVWEGLGAPGVADSTRGEGTHLEVVSVVGGLLGLSRPLARAYPAGAGVSLSYQMIVVREHGVTLDGLTIDGGGVQPAPWVSWEAQHSVAFVGTAADWLTGCVMRRCTLVYAWADHAELMFCLSPLIESCTYEHARGSALHLSSTDRATLHGSRYRWLGTDALRVDHAEGAVTWSWANEDVHIEREHVEDCDVYAWGSINLDTHNAGLRVRRCSATRTRGLLSVRGAGEARVDIQYLYGIDCGGIDVLGGIGRASAVHIADCTLAGASILLDRVDGYRIHGTYLHAWGVPILWPTTAPAAVRTLASAGVIESCHVEAGDLPRSLALIGRSGVPAGRQYVRASVVGEVTLGSVVPSTAPVGSTADLDVETT